MKIDLKSLPKTRSEAISCGSNKYYTGMPCPKGHDTYRYVKDRVCYQCVKDKVKHLSTVGGGNARRWANKTDEDRKKINERRREYNAKTRDARNAEKKRSYDKLKQNPEWVSAKNAKVKEYRKINGRPTEKSNPEVKRKYKLSAKGRAKRSSDCAKRHSAKINRAVAWADKARIQAYYDVCSFFNEVNGYIKYHVDHEIPLQGKLVSGLHVHNNLRVIPWQENVKKANRYEPA